MKKKRNKHQQIVNEKVMRAQQKNEFMRKFRHLFILLSDEETYKMLPAIVLDKIYEYRAIAIKVVAAAGHTVPSGILKDGKKILNALIKEHSVCLESTPGKEVMTLDDYFTVACTFIRFYNLLENTNFHKAAEVKQRLRRDELSFETHTKAIAELIGIFNTISGFNSNIGKRVYWVNFDVYFEMNGRRGIFQQIEMHSHLPDKIMVNYEGMVRPAYRLCWGVNCPDPELKKMSIDVKDLGRAYTKSNKSFEVYIQSHALQRLSERLDNICTGLLHYCLIESFIKPVFHRDPHGNILVEYRMVKNKTGYFPIMFYEDKIVLKTFLFLTNKGTPEGNQLLANTGLSVEDTKYLAINKLSAFMSSDIMENEKVKKVFVDAGCDSLFKLPANMILESDRKEKQSISQLIAEYLGLNADDFEFEEEEEE